ncbi:maleylacetoacetate isomerase [Shewanella sp. GXUN23E]|uniref:maleylacetoacetate isomerase n=1 Tax=Shewanella sp. GXUN23E TaxID=3422498 RepID=UPI003D7ED3AD
MTLYGYWRSSAAYRVRIALNIKNIEAAHKSVHLVNNGGEQHSPEYVTLNPQQLVPALVLDNGEVLTQSLAIIEYLEQAFPVPRLLPTDAVTQAKVRALAGTIACDIHPLNNLRVLQYLTGTLGVDDEAKTEWYRHWINIGFSAIEPQLAISAGQYCFGDTITLADVCLVPQVYNARRFNMDLTAFPHIVRIADSCNMQPAFAAAAPENQADAS